jgi:Tfp pilus assembly protein PilN
MEFLKHANGEQSYITREKLLAYIDKLEKDAENPAYRNIVSAQAFNTRRAWRHVLGETELKRLELLI